MEISLNIENTTILDVAYVASGNMVKARGPCVAQTHVSNPLCRVEFVTQTSENSAVRAEAWLPDKWNGRFLALGNGGLGGCTAYSELDYGSAMRFATVGSNNGHECNTAVDFLGSAEVLNDSLDSYGGGCREANSPCGGCQGTQTALKYPEDFDGILAGALAADWNHLLHWTAGPSSLWKIVAAKVLAQCDILEGVRDGIITEPDACDFRPEAPLCANDSSGKCLTPPQIEALRKLYAPHYNDGELLSPRFDPGSLDGAGDNFNGEFPRYPKEWLSYAALNATDFDFSKYGPAEGRPMGQVNPAGIATFNGDMSAFRNRGGKFLAYHGRMDPQIPSGSLKRVYDLVARTLGSTRSTASGMGHCSGGPGAASFG
ncbi:tannase and feruloyl esterase [Mycena polygramma]|nr:tannase and feruloyl esterase [Mycena polygramma]